LKLNNSLYINDIKKSKDYFNHLKFHTQKGGGIEIDKTIQTFADVLEKIKKDPELYSIQKIKDDLKIKTTELDESTKRIELLKN